MKVLFRLVLRLYGKEGFKVDGNISSGYLWLLLWGNIWKVLRGFLHFFSFSRIILVGADTRLLAKNKMFFLGRSCHIDSNCHIDALSYNGISFGNAVSVQKRVIIECSGSLQHLGKGLVLGDNVGIGSNSFLGCAGGIEIGADTIIGNYVSMHSENHNFSDNELPIRLQGVTHKGIKIGKNCWIGAKVTILDGTILGDGCVVAAGAVLTGKEYPANMIIGGVPAKVIRSRL
jgi:acetyltransferase-like isoleucine patch superfamily enzyme